MKAGNYRTPVKIFRKTTVETEYRSKEDWIFLYNTKCFFEWIGGARENQNSELFYSQQARITVRSYVDIQDEDHVEIDGVTYRVISIDREPCTEKNATFVHIEKINV